MSNFIGWINWQLFCWKWLFTCISWFWELYHDAHYPAKCAINEMRRGVAPMVENMDMYLRGSKNMKHLRYKFNQFLYVL